MKTDKKNVIVVLCVLFFITSFFVNGYKNNILHIEFRNLAGDSEGVNDEMPIIKKPVNNNPSAGHTEPASAAKEEVIVEPVNEKLLRELSAGADEVVFDYDCYNTIADEYRKIANEHPDLFWLDGTAKYSMSRRGTSTKVTLKVGFLFEESDIGIMKDALEKRVNEYLVGCPDSSDYDKILYIHDRMVNETEYDYGAVQKMNESGKNNTASTAYAALVMGKAICSGYSAAFRLLMNRLGIECIYVDGRGLEKGESHRWNAVRCDGDWYHIDVTWDDPTVVGQDEGTLSHEYFLVTEKEILKTHSINEGQNLPECTVVKYNYYVYNDMYAPVWDYDLVSEILSKQAVNNEKGEICVKFDSAEEAASAVTELVEKMRIFTVPGLENYKNFTYGIGRTGLLYFCWD